MKLLVSLLAASALAVVGCAGEDPAGVPDDTTMRVHSVAEVVDGDVTGPVHVSGFLIDDGSGWRLCELVLESYPPQCGDPSLDVEGLDEAEFDLEVANGVRWTEGATLVGEITDGTLEVTGSATSS